MDLRTGHIYESLDEAEAAGVRKSDLIQIDEHLNGEAQKIRERIQTLKFGKSPFATIKSRSPQGV